MAVMQAADLDGNGSIDYEEFIVSTVNLSRLNKQVRQAWRLLGSPGDSGPAQLVSRYDCSRAWS